MMKISDFDLIIFDIDDTIISESQFNLSGFKFISKIISQDKKIHEEDLFGKFQYYYELGFPKIFNKTLDFFNLKYDDIYIENLVQKFREHSPQIKLYDDFLIVVKYLRKNNKKIGIITDGFKKTQRNKINYLKLDEIVDYIIVTDELGKEFWKPHPLSFEKMKNYFEIDYRKMVYIGDNPLKDFAIKRNYPIFTVQINRNGLYSKLKYLDDIEPDLIVSSLDELI
ncbi:HAD family hydrolase [Haploplasma modicum]|uniref:HAD family hydrolase n=1 Tax=Haploplasma modicum TaxID=2150 RepID=UPI00138B0AC0|nr:HAD-IA family hydrolase [Haploplasma modicum]